MGNRVQDEGLKCGVEVFSWRGTIFIDWKSMRRSCFAIRSVTLACDTSWGIRVQGPGSRVQGPGFMVQGSGSRVLGSGCTAKFCMTPMKIRSITRACRTKRAESFGSTTRWITTLSSKVNLPHVINFGASCGENRSRNPRKFEAAKPSKSAV